MRYYFKTQDEEPSFDDEGVELASLAEACTTAARGLGEFLKERPQALWRQDGVLMQVADETGLQLFSLRVSVTLSPAMNGRYPQI